MANATVFSTQGENLDIQELLNLYKLDQIIKSQLFYLNDSQKHSLASLSVFPHRNPKPCLACCVNLSAYMALSSPILALLNEPDYGLKEHALHALNNSVDEIWPEVADHLAQIEELFEDPSFPAQTLAALVASKVYYHLGDFDQSVQFALHAGKYLDMSSGTEYSNTIVAKAIRHYVDLRQQEYDAGEPATIDAKLVSSIELLLENCVKCGQTIMALGVALEARRLDIVEAILKEKDDLEYFYSVFDSCTRLVNHREFRNRVLTTLHELLTTGGGPGDAMLVTKIIVQLDRADLAIQLFEDLVDRDVALAYQIAFDLVTGASQELLAKTSVAFASAADQRRAKLVKVLSGVPTCDYEITFLQRNNHADMTVLNRTKAAFDARNSMFHSAVSFQSAFLLVGTTCDTFFRENIDWLGRAQHWTKFTATAALGVIHRGNLTQGRRILKPYLPGGQGSSSHSRGGSLYGLGLVFAGFGAEVLEYLQSQIGGSSLDETQDRSDDEDVALHGACLGVGLAAMRTGNVEVYENLRTVLYTDSAIAGEAAGLAMGLVMLGSRSEMAEEEMLQYSHDTKHEKIIHSLAMGLALLNYGKEEGSDALVDRLMAEQEPLLRYGGCFTLALAYAGTGSNKAIRKLLHTAVSDASDDVRRAAVMGLGFILLRNPSALPRMVELLSESHNPHVRYGTTMALGVACAGTAMTAAVDLLEPMMKDPVDFVRQGAMIALAMIQIQQTDQTPRVSGLREQFANVISAKHEDAMAKFGAALALGIIDAGGCNATISLENPQTGNLNMKAVAGLAVFLQYWYWFPLAHFLSLAFTPTTVVGVNEDLKIPEFKIDCTESRSLFGYPPRLEEENSKAPEQLVTAILSTTLKDKRRARARAIAKGEPEPEDKMVIDEAADGQAEKSDEKENGGETKAESEVPVESGPYLIDNMSRVVPWQRQYIEFGSSPFQPVVKHTPSGVIVVRQTKEGEYPVIKTLRQASNIEDETEEAPLPRPFIVRNREE